MSYNQWVAFVLHAFSWEEKRDENNRVFYAGYYQCDWMVSVWFYPDYISIVYTWNDDPENYQDVCDCINFEDVSPYPWLHGITQRVIQ